MTATTQRAAKLAAHQARAAQYAALIQQYTADSGVQVSAAVIATVDGLEIASVKPRSSLRPAQLAAMAGSLLAVANATGREVSHADCERLIVQSTTGTLLVKPLASGELVLCMALLPATVLGKALWAADAIASGIAQPA